MNKFIAIFALSAVLAGCAPAEAPVDPVAPTETTVEGETPVTTEVTTEVVPGKPVVDTVTETTVPSAAN